MRVASSKKRLVKSEKVIENEILQYLNLRKIFCWKNQSIGVFDPTKGVYRCSHNPWHIKGVADILGIYKGRMLAIEVKSAVGRPSPGQVEFINKIREDGGIAFIARSLDDVISELKRVDQLMENNIELRPEE